MRIKLNGERREALRGMLLAFLNMSGDIPLLVDQGHFERAERRCRQTQDCLDLLLGDIGLEPANAEVELELCAEDAKRIFSWLRDEMSEFQRIAVGRPADDPDAVAASLVLASCNAALAELNPQDES